MNAYQNVFAPATTYFYNEPNLFDLACTKEFNRAVTNMLIPNMTREATFLCGQHMNALSRTDNGDKVKKAKIVINGIHAFLEFVIRHALNVEFDPAVLNVDTLVYDWDYAEDITAIVHAVYMLMDDSEKAKYKDVYEEVTSLDDDIAYPSIESSNPAWYRTMEFRALCLNRFIDWFVTDFLG